MPDLFLMINFNPSGDLNQNKMAPERPVRHCFQSSCHVRLTAMKSNTENGPDISQGEAFAFRLERSVHKDRIFVAVPLNVCDNPACSCRDLGMAVYDYPGEGKELAGDPAYTFVLDLLNRSLQQGYGSSLESLSFGESFLDHTTAERWALYDEAFTFLKKEAMRKKKILKGTTSSVAGQILPVYDEKTGRNDPCPCGSGKKYKNCCGK